MISVRRLVSGALCALVFAAVSTSASDAPPALTAEKALQRLVEGNKRFVTNHASHPHQTAAWRAALAKGQTPFVAVLCCADSRVSPEILFDQGLGDLFVVRNAGNVLDDHVLGSLEYAVEHLHVPLIVVLGHENCGAVCAAVAGGHCPGHIHSVIKDLEPAVAEARSKAGDKVDNTVKANVHRVSESLNHSEPILHEAIKSGKLKVVGACYRLKSGAVELDK